MLNSIIVTLITEIIASNGFDLILIHDLTIIFGVKTIAVAIRFHTFSENFTHLYVI